MKRFLLTTSAFALMCGGALAQTATAGVGSSAINTDDSASTTIAGEAASAVGDNGGVGLNEARAAANVGDGVIVNTDGNQVGPNNIGSADITSGGFFNSNVQFQLGNGNMAINQQIGTQQESGTLQIGDNNTALISQQDSANEGAIAQVGNSNNAAIVQDGVDNGGAIAQLGNSNTSFGLQVGGEDNYMASSQVGNNNSSVIFQDGENNTAASLQEDNGNQSFISQGGGTTVSLAAINGMVFGGSLPAGASISGSGIASLGSTNNAAANLQLGNGNRSAILQTGNGNSAINYQNSR
ncbi:hypothetical protein [Nitratireductor soli]|uniref:hypothetical protein n=1 Tax=Nitratireductor soli TaxID=1670619 RepID=UPI000ACE98F1|nr:hypothetical protein [Nitratireductor soli]